MNHPELVSFVKKHLEDNKADNIVEMDVTSLTDCMDIMMIASATSTRHAKSIASKLVAAAKAAGIRPLGIEGEIAGEWVLIDLGDIVVHVMLKSQRDLYQLEKLWAVTERFKQERKPE